MRVRSKINTNEGSLVDFDAAFPHGKFDVVKGPPVAPLVSDAVVSFAEYSNGVSIIGIAPIQGAGMAVHQGSLQQTIHNVDPIKLTYDTSGGFAFSPN